MDTIGILDLGLISQAFRWHFATHRRHTHAVWCAFRCAHAYWMLTGACTPMLCPICVFRRTRVLRPKGHKALCVEDRVGGRSIKTCVEAYYVDPLSLNVRCLMCSKVVEEFAQHGQFASQVCGCNTPNDLIRLGLLTGAKGNKQHPSFGEDVLNIGNRVHCSRMFLRFTRKRGAWLKRLPADPMHPGRVVMLRITETDVERQLSVAHQGCIFLDGSWPVPSADGSLGIVPRLASAPALPFQAGSAGSSAVPRGVVFGHARTLVGDQHRGGVFGQINRSVNRERTAAPPAPGAGHRTRVFLPTTAASNAYNSSDESDSPGNAHSSLSEDSANGNDAEGNRDDSDDDDDGDNDDDSDGSSDDDKEEDDDDEDDRDDRDDRDDNDNGDDDNDDELRASAIQALISSSPTLSPSGGAPLATRSSFPSGGAPLTTLAASPAELQNRAELDATSMLMALSNAASPTSLSPARTPPTNIRPLAKPETHALFKDSVVDVTRHGIQYEPNAMKRAATTLARTSDAPGNSDHSKKRRQGDEPPAGAAAVLLAAGAICGGSANNRDDGCNAPVSSGTRPLSLFASSDTPESDTSPTTP